MLQNYANLIEIKNQFMIKCYRIMISGVEMIVIKVI